MEGDVRCTMIYDEMRSDGFGWHVRFLALTLEACLALALDLSLILCLHFSSGNSGQHLHWERTLSCFLVIHA